MNCCSSSSSMVLRLLYVYRAQCFVSVRVFIVGFKIFMNASWPPHQLMNVDCKFSRRLLRLLFLQLAFILFY
jgi:hypothetical protein